MGLNWELKNNKLYAYKCNECSRCEIENNNGICTIKKYYKDSNRFEEIITEVHNVETKLKQEGF